MAISAQCLHFVFSSCPCDGVEVSGFAMDSHSAVAEDTV